MSSNNERAARARVALEALGPFVAQDLEVGAWREPIVDLITDLLHLARREGVDEPLRILETAGMHYTDEISTPPATPAKPCQCGMCRTDDSEDDDDPPPPFTRKRCSTIPLALCTRCRSHYRIPGGELCFACKGVAR